MSFLVCGRAPQLHTGTFTRPWVIQTLKTLTSELNPALKGTTLQVRTFSSCSAHISVFLSSIVLSFFGPSFVSLPPVASPPLSTHLFSLPLGFKLLPWWLLATDRCLLLCGCTLPDFTWTVKSRFIPRPCITHCLDYLSQPNLSLSSWHIPHSLFFFVQGAIWRVTMRTVCVKLWGLCVPSGSPSRPSGTDRERRRDQEVRSLPGEEEEEKEEEEGEEETARPLSLGQSLPYNLNTIPDTYTKDCVENNLFHKGIHKHTHS